MKHDIMNQIKSAQNEIELIKLSKTIENEINKNELFMEFIDLKYQKKGFGISTAKLAVDILKNTNSNICIKLASEKDNYKAHNLYLSLGFKKSPKLDGDDIVFVL